MTQIYVPDALELDPYITRIHKWAPDNADIHKRAERARDIVLANKIRFDPVQGWHVESQSQSGKYATTGHTCTCPDMDGKQAPIINDTAYCKHRLAMLIYTDILTYHLRQRIVGETRWYYDIEKCRNRPHTYLLFDESGAICTCFSRGDRIPRTICRTGYHVEGPIFATTHEMGAFAIWMTKANPLPGESTYMAALQASNLYFRLVANGFSRDEAAQMVDAGPLRNRSTRHLPYRRAA